ncbi:MAG: MtrB/PioB family outer membrane beta-barrel protein, partial [Geobacteraceae bacterium]|nr:MtrB/PioB family outer membrane beta-barrel protein [Geobacteraceae bacterium]
MKRSILTVLAIISACTATAMAEEYNGALSVGGSYSNISGQKAKFNEYKNLGSGAQVGLDLNYRGDSGYYWSGLADFSLMNGRSLDDAVTTDMNFNFKTGKTDVFKASLFYNEITHNITDNARTFQSGIGTSVISGPTPTATNFVNSFDYGIKRKNYGAEAEVSLKSPFFFLTHVERNEAKGLLPMSIRDTTTIEAPAPIDYATDTLFLQTGYRSKEIIFTIDGSISKFNNDNTAFSSYVNNVRTFAYLPPNNESYSIGGALMYKIPVFDSVLMVRASNVLTDSSFQFRESIPAGRPTWNGKVQDTSASIALTSRPLSKLSTN